MNLFQITFFFVSQILLLQAQSRSSNIETIPSGCELFDFDNSDRCRDAEFWNDGAIHFCQEKADFPYRFIVIFNPDQTCEREDRYKSVKVVCCPPAYEFKETYDASISDESSESQEEPAIPQFDCGEFEQVPHADEVNFVNERNPMRENYFPKRKYRFRMNLVDDKSLLQKKSKFYEKCRNQIEELKLKFSEKCSAAMELSRSNKSQAKYLFQEFKNTLGIQIIKFLNISQNVAKMIDEEHEKNIDDELAKLTQKRRQQMEAIRSQENFTIADYEKAIFEYVDVLLHDRIHLVNRYDRLNKVDIHWASFFGKEILCRLKKIEETIEGIVEENKNQFESKLDLLIYEHREVNGVATILLSESKPTCSASIDIWEKKEKYDLILGVSLFAFLVCLIFIILLNVLMKRRSKSRSLKIFTGIEVTDSEPLQTKGFENPTYKFFEAKIVSS